MAKTQFTEKKHQLSPKDSLGALVALVVAFLLLASVITVAQKYFTIKKHIRELSAEQKILKEKKESLNTMNAFLSTPEGTEKILREKYNVVKPGEGIVVVVDPEITLPQQPASRVSRWWHALVEMLGIGTK
jgi:cell division protein FtsB